MRSVNRSRRPSRTEVLLEFQANLPISQTYIVLGGTTTAEKGKGSSID